MSQQFQNITLVEVTTSRQVLSRVIMDQGELIHSFIHSFHNPAMKAQ